MEPEHRLCPHCHNDVGVDDHEPDCVDAPMTPQEVEELAAFVGEIWEEG